MAIGIINQSNRTTKVIVKGFAGRGGNGGGGAVNSVNGQTGTVVIDADDISDASTDKKFTTAANLAKLSGISAGATVNSTDASLRDRTTHTGVQPISTVTGLQTALDGKAALSHSHLLSDLSNVNISSPVNGQVLKYSAGLWVNGTDEMSEPGVGTTPWGNLTGSLSDQTDLQSALNAKVNVDGAKVLTDVNFTTAKDTKLTGIATGATANATDASLRDRSTHTGTQAQSTIVNLTTDLAGKAAVSHTHTASQITDFNSAALAAAPAETGAGIKSKLEALSGANRLDASAIQNLPSGGSIERAATFSAITASTTPRTIIVLADETEAGLKSMYVHDGTELHKIAIAIS